MTTWGISMCKDEIDVLPWTLPRMLGQVDRMIVADNGSTDGTRDYLGDLSRQIGGALLVLDDPEPAYLQSEKMTRLAHLAGSHGAEWVIPSDADEVWWSPAGRLADVLDTVRHCDVIEATLHDHVVTALDDPLETDVCVRISRRRPDPLSLPKVACRVMPGLVIEMGNHGARYPGKVKHDREPTINVCHFPYRSVWQMASKSRNGGAAYAAAGSRVPSGAGSHWKNYSRFLDERGIEAIDEIFTTWFYLDAERAESESVLDPCPVPMP